MKTIIMAGGKRTRISSVASDIPKPMIKIEGKPVQKKFITLVRLSCLEIKVIGLTGAEGGGLATVADVSDKVPETETYMIQELHLSVYHCLCLMLEDKFFGE